MGTRWVTTTSPGCRPGRILPDSTGVACHCPVFTWYPAIASAQKASTSTRVLNPLLRMVPSGGLVARRREARVCVVTVAAFMAATLRSAVEPAEDEVHQRARFRRCAGQTVRSVVRLYAEPVAYRLADLERVGELTAHAGVCQWSDEALFVPASGGGRVAAHRTQRAVVDQLAVVG